MRFPKFWLGAMICASLFVSVNSTQAADGSNALALSLLKQRTLPSILGITVQDHNKKTRHGGGFFVDDAGLFVTNFSLIENARRITIRDHEGWLHEVDDVIALSRENDLALLRAEGINSKPLELLKPDRALRVGEAAIVVGSASGLQWRLVDGVISATDARSASNSRVILFMAPISTKSSGSPLVNQYGRVMGVVRNQAQAEKNQAETQAVHVDHVRALMNTSVALPLSATWTDKREAAPAIPPARSLKTTPVDTPDINEDAEATETAELPSAPEPAATAATREPDNDRTTAKAEPAPEPTVKAEARTEVKAEAEEPTDEVPAKPEAKPEPPEQAKPVQPEPKHRVVSHIGQVRTLAWGGVNAPEDPRRACPPMISYYIEDETDIRVVSRPESADAILSMSAALDTSEECNMWGCFDGYRLAVNFQITNLQGRQLYQDRVNVDEDDLEEACEELADEIVDELEEFFD